MHSPAVIASFQDTLDAARHELRSKTMRSSPEPATSPLSAEEIATIRFNEELQDGDDLRDLWDRYASMEIDPGHLADLRAIFAGSAPNELIDDVVGREIKLYQKRGHHAWVHGSPEWRRLASRLAQAELAVLERSRERNDGRGCS